MVFRKSIRKFVFDSDVILCGMFHSENFGFYRPRRNGNDYRVYFRSVVGFVIAWFIKLSGDDLVTFFRVRSVVLFYGGISNDQTCYVDLGYGSRSWWL